ncbi:hypothetical protein BOW53_07485 [Solemya pervernicosa gill symbiont]|uniref:HupH hydrogenase expression protein C-terminal domain-containing protein n=1 Tax=Solemya pervernicosa gill symbiont TaxID=642797 RepID=A0A1T2L5X2_9GAMM|nr:hydrogenase expression/formation protein [Solemya pervernicosa gill symbiont]OOZ40483.1 hypothetical protein BOW53_07485 [Solemya pervernicosa gill symbiont]
MGCEVSASCGTEIETGNTLPILHEIQHALQRLIKEGETTTIDLRAIPLAPGEEQRLETLLGQGEVKAQVDALGETTIQECGVAGVWLITHFNSEEEILGKFIEVTSMPSILESQHEDIREGVEQLSRLLNQAQ